MADMFVAQALFFHSDRSMQNYLSSLVDGHAGLIFQALHINIVM